MLHQMRGGGHDHGHAGLVVRPQQRRAVRRYDRLALQLLELRELIDLDRLRLVARQHDVRAIVVLQDLRLDILARRFRRSVLVGQPGDGRSPGHVARDRTHDDPTLMRSHVLELERFHLLEQQLAQLELARRAGVVLGLLHRCGFDLHIATKAIQQCVHRVSPHGVTGAGGGPRPAFSSVRSRFGRQSSNNFSNSFTSRANRRMVASIGAGVVISTPAFRKISNG